MPYKDVAKQRESQYRYYLKHKDKYTSKARQDRQAKRKYLDQYKSKPCMDCNMEYPPYVMDLDHRDGSTKIDGVAYILVSYGWKKLFEEIAKCDLVCANCHRIRTHNRIQASS